MTLKNQELVAKAAIVADDLATGGKLNDEQSDRFLDFVYDESVLPSFARMVKFRNENLKIDKIGVGKRAAVPKHEGIDPGVRRGIKTSQVTLTPQEIMLPTEIGDRFKEHNIEGESVTTTVLRIFGRQLNNDLEELQLHGNTGGYLIDEDAYLGAGSTSKYMEDKYMALFNGALANAQSGNVVDFAGGTLSASMFRQALSAMPHKFKRQRQNLKFLVPVEIDEMWRERVSSRATAAGDRALNGSGNLSPFGIEMIPVPLMEMNPRQVKTGTFTGASSSISLDYQSVTAGSVVVLDEDDAASGASYTPYIEDTDYSVDYVNGTVTVLAGAIGNTDTVRIQYRSLPQIILTMKGNLIIAIGRDVRIEKDRDIYRGMDQYAITVKADTKYEEDDAVVVINNISDQL